MIKTLTPLLFFVALSTEQVYSQVSTDTAFLSTSIENAKNVYRQFIGGNAHLYNGSEHKIYQSLNDEHPYFISGDWENGRIVYDNELNENVSMLYDLKIDKVVIENYTSYIELVSKKISEFTLHGHTFINLRPDKTNQQMEEGFYDRLYNGNIKIYVRRVKQYEERIESNVVLHLFTEKNHYYLLKNGQYFPVNSKASLLNVLVDEKKALRQHLSKSRISYRNEKEKAMVDLAEFYDSLKQ